MVRRLLLILLFLLMVPLVQGVTMTGGGMTAEVTFSESAVLSGPDNNVIVVFDQYLNFIIEQIIPPPPIDQPPTYSHINVNDTVVTLGDNVSFSVLWADDVNLSFIIFAHNQSGTLTNVSNMTINGTLFNATFYLNNTLNTSEVFCWLQYANDSLNNWTLTPYNCITIRSPALESEYIAIAIFLIGITLLFAILSIVSQHPAGTIGFGLMALLLASADFFFGKLILETISPTETAFIHTLEVVYSILMWVFILASMFVMIYLIYKSITHFKNIALRKREKRQEEFFDFK